MDKQSLTEIEQDFIDFTIKTNKLSEALVLKEYLEIKNYIKFGSEKYRQFCIDNYKLGNLYYGEHSESQLIAAYEHHALMHLYRFLSYSFPKPRKRFEKIYILAHTLRTRNYAKIILYVKKTLGLVQKDVPPPTSPTELSDFILKNCSHTPLSIIDYGCGPAYVSFAMVKLMQENGQKPPHVTLVDIPSLISDFVVFRFKKHGFDVSFIPVTADYPYPELPEHSICLISEVMEHVKEPLKVFSNIDQSLKSGGVIFGNFEDHEPHLMHISHNLSELRAALSQRKYRQAGAVIYKKPI